MLFVMKLAFALTGMVLGIRILASVKGARFGGFLVTLCGFVVLLAGAWAAWQTVAAIGRH